MGQLNDSSSLISQEKPGPDESLFSCCEPDNPTTRVQRAFRVSQARVRRTVGGLPHVLRNFKKIRM